MPSFPFALTRATLVALALTTPALARGQQRIRVLFSHPLEAPSNAPLVEPHLAVDPRDARHLVAAAMTPRASSEAAGCFVFASFDGGESWSTQSVPETTRDCADVWTAIDREGAAVLAYLGKGGIVVRRSANGGRTWPESLAVIKGFHDHVMVTTDPSTGVIYVVSGESVRNADGERRSTLFVAASKDGARTFSDVQRVTLSSLSYEAQTPVLLRDGRMLIGSIDHHDAADRPLATRRASVVRSTRTRDHFGEAMLVTEACSSTRFTAWPSLTAVPRGAGERILFTCEAEGNRGILLAHSDDAGNTWSAVRRIDGGAATASTKTPALAVSPDGVGAVTWIDQRDDAAGRCWSLYASATVDGGGSLLEPRRISDAPSCPTAAGNGAGVMNRFPTGGEYTGLAAIGPRRFLAVWPEARNGRWALQVIAFEIGER